MTLIYTVWATLKQGKFGQKTTWFVAERQQIFCLCKRVLKHTPSSWLFMFWFVSWHWNECSILPWCTHSYTQESSQVCLRRMSFSAQLPPLQSAARSSATQWPIPLKPAKTQLRCPAKKRWPPNWNLPIKLAVCTCWPLIRSFVLRNFIQAPI